MKAIHFLLAICAVITIVGCNQQNKTTAVPTEQVMMNNEIAITSEDQTELPNTAAESAMQEETLVEEIEIPETPSDEQIQQALKNAGVYQGAVDGKIGPKSKAAIKSFQEQSGLVADGKVGRKTWAKLGPYLNSVPAQEEAPVPVE